MVSESDRARRAGPRVIKRYANRKLYDTQESRYVTLRAIEVLIREGEDVRIIDNNTKEDLTSVTLAQVLLKQERKGGNIVPSALRDLIHARGERFMASIRESPVGRLIGRGEGSAPDAEAAAPAPGSPAAKRVAEVLEHGRGALDELQKRIDERVRATLNTLAPWVQLQEDVRRLAARVTAIEKAVRRDRDGGNTE